jgi:hypothetical protein
LGIFQVAGPLRKEASHIHIESCSADKDLCIPGPAQAFIPLRTICGNIYKITLLSPEDIVLELIDQWI